jgi:hypothetical protein
MISDADREAFTLALEMFRARGHRDAEYIDEKLEREGFKSAGHFAAYSCQMRSLHLPPWATPPCWINAADIDAIIARGDDGTRGNYVAAKIVRRLRELGISQFHPDPMTAIESAKKRDAAA